MNGHTGTGVVGLIAIICLIALCWVGGLATLQMRATAEQAEAEAEIIEARAAVQMQIAGDNARLAILQQGQDHFRQDLILLMAAMHDDGQFTDEEIDELRALVDGEEKELNIGPAVAIVGGVAWVLLIIAIAARVAWLRGWEWYKEWWLFQEGRYRE